MCRASTEPGGAKRCATHTREGLEKASNELDKATKKYVELTSIRRAMKDIDDHPGFFYELRNKRLVVKLAERLYDSEEERQQLLTSYVDARKKHTLMVRRLKDEAEMAGMHTSIEEVETSKEEMLQKNIFSNVFFDEYSSKMDDEKITSVYLDAKKKRDEAEAAHLGTIEGISAHVMDSNNYDVYNKPKDELSQKLAIFSKQSRNRESLRRGEMERIRLRAKGTTRASDWDEYQKWQNAWNRDPTLINNDSYYIAERSANRVVLTAAPWPATAVHRWGIELTKNPETGKISHKIIRPGG